MLQDYTGTPWDVKHYRTSEGKLASVAWPGGYPLYYMDGENNILCPDCANDSEQPENAWSDEHKPIAGSVFEEGPSFLCDQCNKEIESAYGDPDEQEEENSIYA